VFSAKKSVYWIHPGFLRLSVAPPFEAGGATDEWAAYEKKLLGVDNSRKVSG
jgi:hypothetical protein